MKVDCGTTQVCREAVQNPFYLRSRAANIRAEGYTVIRIV